MIYNQKLKGDLINREDLKKRLKEMFDTFDVILFDDIIAAIDNAPTVEAFTEEYVSGAYNEGYMCGSREAEKARPQGEWNYIQAGMCVCPFCGAMPHKLYKNYCAKCGAELKGGAE